jgi:hypothetical protein
MTTKRTKRKPAPCNAVRGLTVTHRPDGCVLRIRASNGAVALINLDAYAQGRAPGARAAIEQWIQDVRPNARGDSLPPQEKTHE